MSPDQSKFLSFSKETYLTHKDPVIFAQWVREIKEVIEKKHSNLPTKKNEFGS